MFRISTLAQWRKATQTHESFQKTLTDIENARTFIKAIQEGNLMEDYPGWSNTEHTANSENSLAEALLQMRDHMKIMAEKEAQRTWITEGLAQFVDILRSHHTDIQQLYDQILASIIKYLKANQGGLFVVREDGMEKEVVVMANETKERTGQLQQQKGISGNRLGRSNISLEMVACYAYNRKKFLTKTMSAGEGLVGQCFLEGDTIYMTEIPQNYVNISSGLGEATPRCILIVPLKLDDKVHGVIELASFSKFESYQIEFIEKLGESIASTIANATVTSMTQKLLDMSQQQAESLRAQEEELRQNLEEMEATQEEMLRRQAQVNDLLQRFDLAARTTTEGLWDMVVPANLEFTDSTPFQWTDKFRHMLGYTNERDFPNRLDSWSNLLHPDHKERTLAAFSAHLLDFSGQTPYDVEYQLKLRNGNFKWFRAVGNTLRDNNGRPLRIAGSLIDIQQSRELEGIMTSVNNTMATIEFDKNGTILDANANFLNLMGYSLEDIKGKHHSLFVDAIYRNSEAYAQFWKELTQGIPQIGEFARLTKNKNKVWLHASYTPIIDQGKVTKIIKFAQDVTHHKKASLDMQGQLQAIDKAFAVIEFTTNGEVLTANDIFLKLMEYDLTAILHKHHSLFVDKEHLDTYEYEQFWRKLRLGETISGNFERVTRSGKKIWIKGSYSPVFDLDGQVYKVIKYAQLIHGADEE
ncbi:PAS domain-containing protein [Xanthocytophaga flava]|uniref:PAS domain-containing protein n=1 Tax=Xanthocytophaga flava TaxID=3048013 RepID=UPI0028D58ED4|nr:PAS domain-containing protein [Xanthocytophaga flavus]MDJ1472887.1 PAS domain-containing protein [Xanthocytophaga flavus]